MSRWSAIYQQLYHEARTVTTEPWFPGKDDRPRVRYPLPMRESAMTALRQEAFRLGRLPFEGASWLMVGHDGAALKLESRTRWERHRCTINLQEMVDDIFACGGVGAVVMHSHPATLPGHACEPSRDDLAAIVQTREALERHGLVLQDSLICGAQGAMGFSAREAGLLDARPATTPKASAAPRVRESDADRAARQAMKADDRARMSKIQGDLQTLIGMVQDFYVKHGRLPQWNVGPR